MRRSLIILVSAVMLSLTELAIAGNIAFKPAQNYPVGTNPSSAVIADFNHDGIPDVAVINSGSNDVSVLLGNGDGTFKAATSYSVGSLPANNPATAIFVDDFNGDGKLDLEILIAPVTGSSSGEVRILTGNGDGTFQLPVNATLANQQSPVAVADFNGDKRSDLVVNLLDASGSAAGVAILFGNGDGTFQAAKTVISGQGMAFFTTGDFNGDGKLDLAVPSSGGSGVQVMLGRGDGTFSPGGQAIMMQSGFIASGARVADLNGDGKPDLIVDSGTFVSGRCGFFQTCTHSSHNVSVFLSGDGNSFGSEQVFGSAHVDTGPCFSSCQRNNTVLTYVTAGDFNGDGILDIASLQGPVNGANFYISPGNGDGTFGSPIAVPLAFLPFATVDLNGDQLADLIAIDSANNAVAVSMNATPAFKMTASAKTLTAGSGEQASDTLSLLGLNGFSSSVQLSCQVTGPQPMPRCSLSPEAVTPGATPATVTLTLAPGGSAGLNSSQGNWHVRPLYAAALPFAFLVIRFKRRPARGQRVLLTVFLATTAVLYTACGGGSSSAQAPQSRSYNVQVTGSSAALTKAVQISLTVQ